MPHEFPVSKLFHRPADAHKGHFGRVLIVGGSASMPGAAGLAGLAALRAGAGLVKLACPRDALPTAISVCPCATGEPLPQTAAGFVSKTAARRIDAQARLHDAVAVGPGMGQNPAAVAVLATLIKLRDKPVVVDADGLNNLAALRKNWPTRSRARLVLTPHPGEMRRLIDAAGLKLDVQQRRHCCAGYARYSRCIVVLKGAHTVVCDGTRVFVNSTGNPGMATGGAGDVLTGVIAALIAQGLDPFDAACFGVHVHGLAGDLAAESTGQISLIASDLVHFLPPAFLRVAQAGFNPPR